MRKQSKQNKGRGRANRGESNDMSISHPPQIPSFEVRHGVRLRFVTSSAVSQSITFQNLLDTILMATTATTGADLFVSVKVRRIQVWATPVLGNATSISLLFGGGAAGAVGDQKLHTDTSMGIQPAHVAARPAAKSLASNYQVSSVDEAFFVVAPSGAVVDVEMSFVGSFNAAVPAQNPLVAANPGAVYLRGLDGLATATTKFAPVYPAGSI